MCLRREAFVVALAIVGCSDGGSMAVGPDAGGDGTLAVDGGDGGDDTATGVEDGGLRLPFVVASPDIPWLERGEPPIARPILTPCPEGWYETELAGETICEPWPSGAGLTCPPGEAQFLGSAGCEPIGGPCPPGNFAEDLPQDRPVLYVREGAPPGGDGSRAAPYATLADALAQSPLEGTVLALGRGSYAGGVMPPGLTLFGACPSETVVTAPEGASYALEIAEGALEVRRLRVAPGGADGIRAISGGTDLTLRAVEIRGAMCVGILVLDQARLDAEELVVREPEGCDPARFRFGLQVWGAAAHVRRSVFADSGHSGVMVVVDSSYDSETEMVLEDSVVREHSAGLAGPHAIALVARPEATASIRATVNRTLVERNLAGGLTASGRGVFLEADRLLARDNGSAEGIDAFYLTQPVSVLDGATLHLTRSVITGTVSNGRFASLQVQSPNQLTVEDVVVAKNKSHGFFLGLGDVRAVVRRVRFSANLGGDVAILGGRALLEDASLGESPLRTWLPDREGRSVAAVYVDSSFTPGEESHLELRRTAIEGAAGAAVQLATDLASVTLEDVAIMETLSTAGGGWGILGGRGVAEGPSVTARRVLFEGNHMGAIEIGNGPGRLTLEDAVIRHTRPFPGQELGGHAVTLSRGSVASGQRVRVEISHEFGFLGFGSTLHLEDVEVLHTRVAGCAGDFLCLEHGHALGAYGGATLEVTRFVLADAASCGVHFAQGSEVDLTDGLVTGTRIGACIQVDGYDPTRLSQGVFYTDNDRNLQATELPVPDPGR